MAKVKKPKLYGNETCRVEFLESGFRTLLFSEEMRKCVSTAAQGIAARAGEGFSARTFYGNRKAGRILGSVDAVTLEARYRQATDKVLKSAAEQHQGVI